MFREQETNSRSLILNEHVRRLLQDISEELCQVIGDSSELAEKLAELRDVGYSLNLLLDCKKLNDEDDGPEPVKQDRELLAAGPAPMRQLSAGSPPPVSSGPAASDPVPFRINARDLAFLRSLGIDPTRRQRSRRPRDEGESNASSAHTAALHHETSSEDSSSSAH